MVVLVFDEINKQVSNLTVSQLSLATQNEDGRLKTHSKVACLVTDFVIIIIFIFFRKYYSGK